MALLALVLIYVAANLRTLNYLSREIKLVEQHQLRRLATVHSATNASPSAGATALSETVEAKTNR